MTFTIGLPQLIFIVLMLISNILNIRDHGKAKTGKENYWHCVIAQIILFTLLFWGGFFG